MQQLLTFGVRHAGGGALGDVGEDGRNHLLELLAAGPQPDDRPSAIGRIGLPPEQPGRLHAADAPDKGWHLDSDARGEHADRLAVLTPKLVQEVVLARVDAMRLEPATQLGVDALERLGDRAHEGGRERFASVRHMPTVAWRADARLSRPLRTATAALPAERPSPARRPPGRRSATRHSAR